MRAVFFFALVFLVVGCRAAQPTAPAAEIIPQVSEPTAVLGEPVSPSGIEAGDGPTQDGRPLAARVNGQPIFLDVYQKQVAQTEQALIEQDLILQGEEGQAQLAQIRQNVLNGLVEQALIEQAATASGISVTYEELEATVQESIAVGQGQESFDQWLAENGLTLDEFREIQRSQLLASKMIEQVTAVVPTTAEQVHARHILVSDLARAQALLGELNAGANFAALAQQSSEDVSTAANGGDLGWFPRDVPLMPPVVVEMAFALEPGGTSDVIQSEQGYHIIKVEAREDNRPLSPEMVLYVRKKAFETWLAEQRGVAVIERYIDM
jgi:parvulin-like peptidyl-prolyl isomerase